jgi:hypothetical protein
MSTIKSPNQCDNHYFNGYCPIPLSINKAKEMLPYVAACNASFKNDESWVLPFDLSFYHPDQANLDLNGLPGQIEMRRDSFFDKSTVLKVSICTNEKIALIVLGNAFGSGDIEAGTEKEKTEFRNQQAMTRDSQIAGDVVPLLYDQANALIHRIVVHPSLKNKKITLVGQSSGCSMAQYIGLKNGMRTICFNPYPMGQALQRDIGNEKIGTASNYVTCVSATNDYCSDLMEKYPSDAEKIRFLQTHSAKNFGRKYTVPSAFQEEMKTHALVMGTLMNYLHYDMRALTSQLHEEDKIFCTKALNDDEKVSKVADRIFARYSCQSPLAMLAQAAIEGDTVRQKAVIGLLALEDKKLICELVWKNAGLPLIDDIQWMENYALDHPDLLKTAIRQAILTMLSRFPEAQKKQVYVQVYNLACQPQTEDKHWGEHNALNTEFLPQLADALFNVLSFLTF